MPFVASIGALIVIAMRVFFIHRIASIVFKVATRIIIFSLLFALFVSILSSIQAAVDQLSAVAPPTLSIVFSWFIPSNFTLCLSAIATVQLIVWAWHWKKYLFDLLSGGVS